MDTNKVVYNRESVQKSIELLHESDYEFRNVGTELKDAIEILKNLKGDKSLSKVDTLANDNTLQNLMTMCDENIGNTICNINNGIEKMENYLANNGEIDLRQLSGVSASSGQQPSAPSQPSAPNTQPGSQPNGPGEGQGQVGPNGEQPPSQPSPPSGPEEGQGQVGPNGEQPPSSPTEPTPPEGATQPSPSQSDMKKGSLLGALIGLGIGAAATGGTTAAVIHSKKKKDDNKISNNYIKIEDNESLDDF